jgi:rod shape-determining protein MreD
VRWVKPAVVVFILVAAVALQTTLFARLRPFDAAPALVVLVVFATARHLAAEAALFAGFFAGVLADLMSETPLGLWSLTLATVAFVVVRFRGRFEDDLTLLAPAVLVVSFGALALYALLGTIFGEKTLADRGWLRNLLLPAVYNLVIAPIVLPLVTTLLGARHRAGLRGFDL